MLLICSAFCSTLHNARWNVSFSFTLSGAVGGGASLWVSRFPPGVSAGRAQRQRGWPCQWSRWDGARPLEYANTSTVTSLSGAISLLPLRGSWQSLTCQTRSHVSTTKKWGGDDLFQSGAVANSTSSGRSTQTISFKQRSSRDRKQWPC